MSRLCRPYLSDRFFFITVRLLERRRKLDDADFESLALAIRRARAEHSFFLTAWVFLPNHWHVILAPQYPLTISEVMNSIKNSSTTLVNGRRGTSGEVWQERFFDRAMRTVKEYNEKVEYIHLNPVKAGLAVRPQDWRWSSVNEYSGMSAADQMRHCGLTIDRVSLPSNPKTQIRARSADPRFWGPRFLRRECHKSQRRRPVREFRSANPRKTKSRRQAPALGIGSANPRKSRGPQRRRSALRTLSTTPRF